MLYLRISQHFHNKPLFSEPRTLPERHRHPDKDTEKERQPSKTYVLGSLIRGLDFQSKSLCVSVAAAHSSSFEGRCQHCAWHRCPLPSRSQLESSLRVVTGCCSALGGWPAPFPDPANCQVVPQPKEEKRGEKKKAPAVTAFSLTAISG